MAINPTKVKQFWDAQAAKSKRLQLEGLANLEEDPKLLAMKVAAEKAKIMPIVGLQGGERVLDLGAGAGQWSFRFSEWAKQVVAVEYSADMLELGREEARRMSVNNIEFVCLPAQDYLSDTPFDVIYISGLLIYLSDDECETLVANCARSTRSGSRLVLRDGTGIMGCHEINDRYSEGLDAFYSASYRTSGQYIDLFTRHGFKLNSHEDMFDEGSSLNKWAETRLRLYCFTRL